MEINKSPSESGVKRDQLTELQNKIIDLADKLKEIIKKDIIEEDFINNIRISSIIHNKKTLGI